MPSLSCRLSRKGQVKVKVKDISVQPYSEPIQKRKNFENPFIRLWDIVKNAFSSMLVSVTLTFDLFQIWLVGKLRMVCGTIVVKFGQILFSRFRNILSRIFSSILLCVTLTFDLSQIWFIGKRREVYDTVVVKFREILFIPFDKIVLKRLKCGMPSLRWRHRRHFHFKVKVEDIPV